MSWERPQEATRRRLATEPDGCAVVKSIVRARCAWGATALGAIGSISLLRRIRIPLLLCCPVRVGRPGARPGEQSPFSEIQ